jgi:hypothetical protein
MLQAVDISINLPKKFRSDFLEIMDAFHRLIKSKKFWNDKRWNHVETLEIVRRYYDDSDHTGFEDGDLVLYSNALLDYSEEKERRENKISGK